LQVGQLKPYGVSLGLIHVKTIAVFTARVQYLTEALLRKIRRGNSGSNNNLTFPQTSGKRSLHLIQKSDHPC